MNKELKKNIEAKAASLTLITMLVSCIFICIFVLPPPTVSATTLTLGNTSLGNDVIDITKDDYTMMVGTWNTSTSNGVIDDISVRFAAVNGDANYQCAVYTYVDYTANYAGTLMSGSVVTSITISKTVHSTDDNTWQKFIFNATAKPTIVAGTPYYLVIRPTSYITTNNKLRGTVEVGGVHGVSWQTVGLPHTIFTFESPITGEVKSAIGICIYANYTVSTGRPTITNPSPSNASTGQALTPTCKVNVTSPSGHTMDVTFATNESGGAFINMQTNVSCINTTTEATKIKWVFADADTLSTTYYWRVYCNDSTTNVSTTYHFTTSSTSGTYTLSGLTTDMYTWAGKGGDILWANDTGDGTPSETMSIYTDTLLSCSDIFIDLTDFDSELYDHNISIEVINAVDGSWSGIAHQVVEAGGNVTLNSAMWAGAGWCDGTNPFPISSATTLLVRARLSIPTSAASGTYVNVATWKVTWKLT